MGRSVSETKVIDGDEYSMVKLPAERALVELTKLLNLLGPGLAAAAKASPNAAVEDSLLPALGEMLARVKESTVQDMLKTFLSHCTVKTNGQELEVYPIRNDFFHGRVFSMLKLLAWCIRCNYADFFDASGGLGAALRAKMESMQKSSMSSTFSGPSGVS